MKIRLQLFVSLFLFLFGIQNINAQLNPPGVQWKRIDYLSKTPDIVNSSPRDVPLDRLCGSEDWWYDVQNTYNSSGIPDGYIACGYSNPFNYLLTEGSSGCYAAVPGTSITCNDEWPDIDCSRYDIDKSTTVQTIAKFDLHGNRIWMKTFNEGTFNHIIVTSDGNFLAVGGTKSTRENDGVTPLWYNYTQVTGNYIVNCTGHPNTRHVISCKT